MLFNEAESDQADQVVSNHLGTQALAVMQLAFNLLN
jgi:hypothetical protein